MVYCRKTNGKKYATGISTIKEAKFPFPTTSRPPANQNEEEVAAGVAVERGEDTFVFQARLHDTTAQLVQANTHCVGQVEEIDSLTRDKEEGHERQRNLERENAALKRRLESLESGEAKLPRPGPSLKSFEDLTPRQQKVASSKLQKEVMKTSEVRRIPPTQLCGYLTFR